MLWDKVDGVVVFFCYQELVWGLRGSRVQSDVPSF